ncbi:Bax inhibitor-1/YccA family protein [Parvularcula flava]|uniref:Bax inhibitor-1/YccA family protein n=1 Tax=Aquisalinus luteolus TaxID=1566827 RepID=A0A8J3AAC1_9PROT|nr:Bax inhibitor-1/YccA family protein [Aquisalinus luteolus]NHK29545.1 Bax inhibitor-1/YccA family protein [Aquisalinus luteolus]GGI01616.1 hypothetical protein GCM10011355_32690 [Aquisalinus luteolus]
MIAIPFGSPLNSRGAIARLPRAEPGQRTAGTTSAIRLLILHFIVMAGAVTAMYFIVDPAGAISVEEGQMARDFGFGAGVIALISALVGRFRPTLCMVMAPVFAVTGGLFMGGLALAAEARYPGIAFQTVCVAGLVFTTMLILYLTRLIRLSERFKMVLATAISAVALIYLVSFASLIFGYRIEFIHGSGAGAALWFGLTAGLAALNLLVDFQRIEALDGSGKGTIAEWHAVLAVLTTFVWMFLSLLRMLRSIRR